MAATVPPGLSDSSGGPPLSGPPPNPVNNPAAQGATPGFGGVPGTPVQPPDQDQGPKMLAAAGMQIDQLLMAMSQAVPAAGAEFSQARQLVQAGIAKALAAGPSGAVAVSPTETGPQFTGSAT